MSLVIDFDKACLICLLENDELVSVYEHLTAKLTIMDKLLLITDSFDFDWMELKSYTKLPNKICAQCVDDLEAACRFRHNCENANKIFRNEEVVFELGEEHVAAPSSHASTQRKFGNPEQMPHNAQVKQESDEDGDGDEQRHQEALVEMHEDNDDGVVLLEMTDYETESQPCETEDLMSVDNGQREGEEVATQEDLTNSEQKYLDGLQNAAETTKTAQRPKTHADQTKECDKAVVLNTAYEEFLRTLPKRSRGRPKKYQDSVEKTQPKDAKANSRNANKAAAVAVKSEHSSKTGKINRDPKICEICGNTYKYQHALVAHMRRHNNERPFTCEVCAKGFVANVELQRHMRTHTGHKPYACSFCDRRFADFGSRRKHERTHTGERPYSCPTCGKTFAYAHVLSVHMRIHTGDKRFKCQLCHRGFTKKSYLETHLEWHSKSATHDVVEYVSDEEAGTQHIILKQVIVQQDGQTDDLVECNDESLTAVEIDDDCIFTTDMIVTEAEVDEKDHAIYEIYTVNENMHGEPLEEDDNDDDDEDNRYTMVMA